MKVQATKKMTDEINKFFKEKKIPYEAVYETMSPAAYKWNVDTFDDHDDDYLANTGKMRSIKILYPYEYYACPHYLTTRELVDIFRKSNKTLDGFMSCLFDEIAA